MGRVLVVFLLVFVTAQGVWAQLDEDIPACTQVDLIEIALIFEEYDLQEDMQLLTNIGSTVEAIEQRIENISEAQLKFWNEVVPELPRCTLSYEFTRAFGRVWDETLISLLALQTGNIEMAGDHLEGLEALNEELVELTGQIADAF